MAAEDFTFTTKGERQARVVAMHGEGLSQTRICELLGVSLRTIVRDCAELELKSWSEVTKSELEEIIFECLQREHGWASYTIVESHLITRYGLRVQERRIRAVLVCEIITSFYFEITDQLTLPPCCCS